LTRDTLEPLSVRVPGPKSLAPLYWGLVVTIALVAAIVASIFWVSARNQSDNTWVHHTLALRQQLSDVLTLVQRAESAQRGYLLTGRSEYLLPYDKALGELPAAIKQTNELIGYSPTQQQTFGRLLGLIDNKLKETRETIDDRKAGKIDMALALVETDEGLRLMDDIHAALATMQAEENRVLSVRQASAASSAALLQVTVAAAFVLVCGVGAMVGYFTQRSFAQLGAARDSLVRSNEELLREVGRRERAESQLRQAQKMEAIGQLTGGIAHDFNNMLGVMSGSLDIMRRAVKKGDFAIERFIDAAAKATERAATLTHRLLAFGRQQPLAPEPIDANKMIASMSDLLRSTLGEHIRIETVSAGGLWATYADAHQLENAILNIAINARDAMQDGGDLTIETGNAYLDEAYCQQNADVEPGQFVMVAITDTGQGIPPEIVSKVFDPFFTTKPIGKGTGLGLSQVYGFVKQSHGHIKIYSEAGNGTTVKIYLPRLIGETKQVKHAALPQVRSGTREEVILVVEDDPLMRQMSADALRDLGYTVLDSGSATEALAIIDASPEIRLLFTDVVMPDVNGKKLADEALRRRPDLKVLFTTGYTRNAVVHGGVLDPGVNFLSKPFGLEQLASKVRAILDA
jgi:signal transduction histidine kinase/CheY-like chemotaxis protein